MNVYVPDDLLAQVRAEDFSVSPVCQQALEAEVVARRLERSAKRNLRAVADRLRQTEDDQQAHLYRDGYAFGVAWAQESATLEELRLAARVAERSMTVQYERLPTLVGQMHAANPDVDVAPDEFLDGETSEFDRGVLVGATEVYRAVEPLLDRPVRGPR